MHIIVTGRQSCSKTNNKLKKSKQNKKQVITYFYLSLTTWLLLLCQRKNLFSRNIMSSVFHKVLSKWAIGRMKQRKQGQPALAPVFITNNNLIIIWLLAFIFVEKYVFVLPLVIFCGAWNFRIYLWIPVRENGSKLLGDLVSILTKGCPMGKRKLQIGIENWKWCDPRDEIKWCNQVAQESGFKEVARYLFGAGLLPTSPSSLKEPVDGLGTRMGAPWNRIVTPHCV